MYQNYHDCSLCILLSCIPGQIAEVFVRKRLLDLFLLLCQLLPFGVAPLNDQS